MSVPAYSLPTIELIDKRSDQYVRHLTPDEVRLVTDRVQLHSGQLLLAELRAQGYHLRCGCYRRKHVRLHETSLSLAFNPHYDVAGGDEEAEYDTCAFCRPSDYSPRESGRSLPPPRCFGLLLEYPLRSSRSVRFPTRLALRFHSSRALLRTIIEAAEWNRLAGALPEHSMWVPFREALERLPIFDPVGRSTWGSRISWLPDRHQPGGPAEFARAVTADWDNPDFAPVLWVFGMIPRGRIRTSDDHVSLQFFDLANQPHEVTVAATGLRRSYRATGPYLMLALGIVHPGTGALEYKEVLLEPILATDCPVPTESGYERDAIRALQFRGIPYHRPVTWDAHRLLPDGFLPSHRLILEVQGGTEPEYRDRKLRTHAHIRQLLEPGQAYDGWELLRWSPNDGETIGDLLRKLP